MDPNLREKDAIEEELELLSSVFSLKGESCVLQARTPRTLIEVTQSVTASSSEAVATTFKISFEIEAEQYPEWQAPKISLTCLDKGLTRAQGLNITEVLNKEAEAYLGSPMLYQLCQSSREAVEQALQNKVAFVETAFPSEVDIFLTLIELDHMRDRVKYCRHLEEWTQDLQIGLWVIHKSYLKRKTHWLMLVGQEEQLQVFKKRLRTQTVDVDSKGRPCKEKMSTDLMIRSLSKCNTELNWREGYCIQQEVDSPEALKLFLSELKMAFLLDEFGGPT